MQTTNILDLNNRIDALEKKQDQDTTDYEKLSNLPKVNNVELKGNKTTSDLGINANTIPYDNTDSGLTATDVQGAIDELRQADNIMMSDSVTSVGDALDAVMPRTATGTTLSELKIAFNKLTDAQKLGCYITIAPASGSTIPRLTLGYLDNNNYFFTCTKVNANSGTSQFILDVTNEAYKLRLDNNASEVSISISAWTIYYQGSPIS